MIVLVSPEDFEGKTVLITGGAGFVGSHLADTVVDFVEHLTLMDNLSTGSLENLTDSLRRGKNKVSFRHGDVRSTRECVRATKGVELVFHLAAQINPARAVLDPVFDFEVNARGTLNVLEAARRNNVKKVVFASTNVYGTPKYVPTDEKHPLDLLSPYAAAKLSGEGYLIVYQNTYGIQAVRLRFSNIYGPRQTTKSESGVVALFLERVLAGQPLTVFGDGEQTRDFVYVTDVVDALVKASLMREADGETFNIGFGAETTINQLATLIPEIASEIRGTELRINLEHGAQRAADFRRGWMNISKAREVLGYSPAVPLREGLKKTIKWSLDSSGRLKQGSQY